MGVGPKGTGRQDGKPVVRHLFPGSNTREGFFSYFSYVWRTLTHPEPRRVWILKGGPGTGKSVFMRGLGEAMAAQGHVVEWHHCAADPDSVDGVVFPRLGAAIVDGTAPHALNPSLPGAVDEIVDLGIYWNPEPLRAARSRIETINIRYKELYAAAYRYLAAAGVLYDEWAAAGAAARDDGKLNDLCWSLLHDWLRGRKAGRPGFVRKLFAWAVTPDGPRRPVRPLGASMERIVVLSGPPGSGKSGLVGRWAQALAEHGLDVELFHCGLSPRIPRHMLVPALGLAVLSADPLHPLDEGELAALEARAGQGPAAARVEVIHLDRMGSPTTGRGGREVSIRQDEAEAAFWPVFQKGMDGLKRARDLHGELEGLYGAAMDFSALDRRREQLLQELTALAEESGEAAPRLP